MKRSLVINASLLLLALILAGLIWIAPEQQAKAQKIPLTNLSPDQITLIVLKNGNGASMRLERTTDGWRMTQPSMAKADTARINDLLEITRTRSIRRFQVPQDLAEFGLKPPQATLTLNQTRIEMGGLHPMNQRRYVRIGNVIHLINDRFPHLLLSGPDSYLVPKDP